MEKQTFLYGKCRVCKEPKVVHRDRGDEREGKIAIGTCSECEKVAEEAAETIAALISSEQENGRIVALPQADGDSA